PTVVSDRGVADELANLLRVLGRDLADELLEHATDEVAGVLDRRQRLLLGPARHAADPEVVVLVEALVGALGEVRPAAREALLECGELLVAVDVDALVLGLDLVLEVVQVLRALLDVDVRDDRGGEVENLLELARGDVEQVPDATRDALEEPDVRDRRGEVDVTHALAAPPPFAGRAGAGSSEVAVSDGPLRRQSSASRPISSRAPTAASSSSPPPGSAASSSRPSSASSAGSSSSPLSSTRSCPSTSS